MPASRSEALKAARQAAFDKWFKDRRWRIATEYDGEEHVAGKPVINYVRGEFHVVPPGKFETPLKHKGRHGFILQEVDPETGADIEGSRTAWGIQVLRKAISQHGAVTGELPDALSQQ